MNKKKICTEMSFICIKGDIKRYGNIFKALGFVSLYIVLLFRLCTWFSKKHIILKIFGIPLLIIYKFLKLLSGIQLPIGTKIGPGLRFHHYSCIVIAQQSKIGKNACIHQGVTIGRVFYGKNSGTPIIGDNLIAYPGAKIFGKIRIGNNVIIGANAVVCHDIPDNCIVAGVPAQIISNDSNNAVPKEWEKTFV